MPLPVGHKWVTLARMWLIVVIDTVVVNWPMFRARGWGMGEREKGRESPVTTLKNQHLDRIMFKSVIADDNLSFWHIYSGIINYQWYNELPVFNVVMQLTVNFFSIKYLWVLDYWSDKITFADVIYKFLTFYRLKRLINWLEKSSDQSITKITVSCSLTWQYSILHYN